MSPSEVDQHLRLWMLRQQRVYVYSFPLLPDEYVTIEKGEGPNFKYFFKCISDHSTRDLGIIKEEDLSRMLMKGEMKHYQDVTWGPVDVWRLKTGGCTCGAWATRDKDCHSPHVCDLMKRK